MNYTRTKIGLIASIKGGKRLPKGHQFSPLQTDHPYIRAQDIRDGRIDTNNSLFITNETFEKISRYTVKTNDVCITIVGANIGDVGIVPTKLNGANLTENAVKLTDLKEYDPLFLNYSLISDESHSQMKILAAGAAQPKLGLYKVYEVEIPNPPLKIQKMISVFLAAYDNLIENNTRRIQILEEMASRVYREWFVHFRFPGHENIEIVESELGMVPKGWNVKPIGKLLSYNIGGGWGKEDQIENYNIPAYVIRGTDIPPARHANVDKCPLRYHTQSNFKSRRLLEGDIIFEVSGGSKDQPLGRSLLVSKKLLNQYSGDVICASFCKLIRPDKGIVFPELLYLHLLETYKNGSIIKYQVQSTGISNFKFSFFLEDHKLFIPDKETIEKFGKIIKPLFDLIQTLGIQNSNLRKSRDLLLPKLISGKIDVSELDIDIGAN